VSRLLRTLPLLLALAGCAKLFPSKDKPGETAPSVPLVGPASTAEAAHFTPGTLAEEKEKKAEKDKGPDRFGVPFAWETSPNEPLAKARGFLAEVLRANQIQVGLGRQHYTPFIDTETPRATIVTCADSRVQSSAWDQTPENDDFVVRNIGNQVNNALGSIEYGVEHLHTPLLLIVGHTGCGAVKAVLEKSDDLSGPIRAELAGLKLPASKSGASAEQKWTDAVIANVNLQVATATEHFASAVHSGDLTIVGALYDLRNSLSKGHGRLHLVNVNTNTDPARIDAFIRAIQSAPSPMGAASDLPGAGAERSASSQKGTAGSTRELPAPPEVTDARIRALIEKATKALPGKNPVATVTTSSEK
jgi:carbonic anhydrase